MCEAETLILAVEKYPCVWNIRDNEYHNRDVKDLAWEQICKEVVKDWDTYSNVEKTYKGADLKKKWTNIRDYFRRELQKNQSAPTGSAAKKVKKYVYADLLNFLTPVFDKRHTEGNYKIKVTEDDNYSQECKSETQEEQVEQVDDYTHTNIQPASPVSTLPASNSKRKRKDIPTLILNIPHQNQQKVNQKRQKEEEDDDTNFLLSFRTHMKHMKENKKIEFKLGMLQLLKKINTDTEYCSASPLNYGNFSDHSVASGSSGGS